MSPNGDRELDAWTGMPLEYEDAHVEPLAVVVPPVKKQHKFDIQGMFWRYVASGSAATPGEVLSCLASDERIQIRRRVAENASTPPDALAQLASDPAAAVRAAVARNPNTPVFLLKQLSQDDDVSVRFAIAANAAMPDAILLSLFMDPDPYVAERASQTMAA